MATLDGKLVVVAGGAGILGAWIVGALLADGARVIVPSRARAKLDALRSRLPLEDVARLVTLIGDIGDPDAAEGLREAVQQVGEPDAVVAALGGWWGAGPLLQTTPQQWRTLLANNLTAHFASARTLLPMVATRRGSSYTLIGGSTTDAPEPGAGGMSITGAAQLMLARVLGEEYAAQPVRVNEVILGPVVTPEREPPIDPQWLTGADVGAFVAWLVSDHAAMVDRSVLRLLHRPST